MVVEFSRGSSEPFINFTDIRRGYEGLVDALSYVGHSYGSSLPLVKMSPKDEKRSKAVEAPLKLGARAPISI